MPARLWAGPFLTPTPVPGMNKVSCALALAAALAALRVHATCWDEAAARYGLPVDLLRAVAKVESHFDANALRKPYAPAT